MKLIPIWIFIFLVNTTNAQKITPTISEEIEEKNIINGLQKIDKDYYGFETDWEKTSTSPFGKVKDGYSVKLKKLDANMALVKEVELDNGEKTFSVNKPFLISVKNQLFFINCKKENEILKIFSNPVDLTNLTLGNPVELLSIDEFSINRFAGADEDFELLHNRLRIIKSPDQNKFLFFWNNQQHKAFQYTVTDYNFQVISGCKKCFSK
jgi:hypothetical protein